jgi:hypothetical protein
MSADRLRLRNYVVNEIVLNNVLGMLWYVDENSADNALRIQLGAVPYDVRYHRPGSEYKQGQSQVLPVAFQAPRRRVTSDSINIGPGQLKNLPLKGEVRTFTEVRSIVKPENT